MNRFLQNFLIPAILALTALPASAYDFAVDGIYYNKLSDNSVEVTYYNEEGDAYRGDVIIPEQVTYQDISYNVTSIGMGAFGNCTSLTSIVIPNSVTEIGDGTFMYCYSLPSILIPNSVTKIGVSTFAGCYTLTFIEIPNSVTEIGDGTFKFCYSLTSIEIPNSVTKIGAYAFERCNSLTSIEIPNSVTEIGDGTFTRCHSLTSIEIPNSVTKIGAYAFSYCGLTQITSRSVNPPTAFGSSFTSDYDATLYVPAEAVETYKSTEPWSLFNNIEGIRGETDSLIEIGSNRNAEYYNLSGMRVNADSLTPGIYIVNGRKVIVR